MTSSFSHLVDPLIKATLKAGIEVMKVYAEDFAVYEKSDASPVTKADQLGEDVIADHLARIAPDITMIGEEAVSGGARPSMESGRFFLVDPLDGTKEFIKKGSDFTVNIGLIDEFQPVLGVVLAPAMKTLYWGVVGEGAWMAPVDGLEVGEPKPISTRSFDADNLSIVASKSHRSDALEDWLSHYPGADNVSIGSSLKFCLLAAGEADLYPRLGPTCEWDTAAADAILRAAGGTVLAPDGDPLKYGKDPTTFLNPWFLCKADPSVETPAISEG